MIKSHADDGDVVKSNNECEYYGWVSATLGFLHSARSRIDISTIMKMIFM